MKVADPGSPSSRVIVSARPCSRNADESATSRASCVGRHGMSGIGTPSDQAAEMVGQDLIAHLFRQACISLTRGSPWQHARTKTGMGSCVSTATGS